MEQKLSQFELIIKELIKNRIKSLADLESFKRKVAKKFRISTLSNMELLKEYHTFCEKKRLKPDQKIEIFLRKRPIRSLSGIVNVSVLTSPTQVFPKNLGGQALSCPGKCLYCPIEKGIPKSYVSGEPAVERAKKLNYNPYLQVQKRIEMLEAEGHPTDKIELRIVGGTWSYYQKKYQSLFIKRCFDACNKKTSKNLKKAQELNEKAKHRIVGLSIETRPDFINLSEIKWLRKLGVTMVELGVQSIFDDVLKKNLRGHKIKETIGATKLLKDAGFKVLYQIMPNLPGSNLKKDKRLFKELFQNPNFQPDFLKIYPCALLKEAPLYKLWQQGKYKPYTEKQLITLIKFAKKNTIPYYCRIQRLVRDIPSQSIVTGPAKISNLRQIITKLSKKEGWRCKCIRCREIGADYDRKEKLYLFRQDYRASDGKEVFLSFEDKKREKIYSLLRLRIPLQVFSKEKNPLSVLQDAAIIRDVHTYGQLHPLVDGGLTPVISPQHKGLGKKLIREAERISKKEFGLKKIAVISGVGARGYYRKLNYELKDSYMVKNI